MTNNGRDTHGWAHASKESQRIWFFHRKFKLKLYATQESSVSTLHAQRLMSEVLNDKRRIYFMDTGHRELVTGCVMCQLCQEYWTRRDEDGAKYCSQEVSYCTISTLRLRSVPALLTMMHKTELSILGSWGFRCFSKCDCSQLYMNTVILINM